MYDTIVIGVGSMGSSACYHLAKRGVKVLGLEQFGITHEMGSHAGQTRIFRKAYFEHPDYVPLLHVAYDGWHAIEKEAGRQMYWESGIVYFGLPENEILIGIQRSAQLHRLKLQRFTPKQSMDRWPHFQIPHSFDGLFEPEAGFIAPELAIQTLVDLAKNHGAEVHSNEEVISWKEIASGVVVESNKATYEAKKLIICAGAYTSELVNVGVPLNVTGQIIGWMNPFVENGWEPNEFPCWMIADPKFNGPFYGFPNASNLGIGGPSGVKLAHHYVGEQVSKIDHIKLDSSREVAKLKQIASSYIPDLGDTFMETKQCLYTNTPDEHFILDSVKKHGNKVLIATGFSGHGFKFVPLVGQVLAELIIKGNSNLPIDFLRLKRFK